MLNEVFSSYLESKVNNHDNEYFQLQPPPAVPNRLSHKGPSEPTVSHRRALAEGRFSSFLPIPIPVPIPALSRTPHPPVKAGPRVHSPFPLEEGQEQAAGTACQGAVLQLLPMRDSRVRSWA